MHIVTAGLVLRETNYREADKMLTVLTGEYGKISVSARGARRKNSKISASSQFLAYSEMTLFEYKGRYTLNEAEVKELFTPLRGELTRLSLASYFAELLESCVPEETESFDLLRLALNSLYALGQKERQEDVLKAAFELKLVCLLGYAPMLDGCIVCGKENPEEPVLDISGGVLCCREHGSGRRAVLCGASLAAMRYISEAELKKMYSFRLQGEAAKRLGKTCEEYTMFQMERKFRTLDFYKSIASML